MASSEYNKLTAVNADFKFPPQIRDALIGDIAVENEFVQRKEDAPGDLERWYIGPEAWGLYIQVQDNYLFQRVQIGGDTWTPQKRQAPSLEVIPAVPFLRPDLPGFATKTGANALNPNNGFQVYAYGHGGLTERAYFCIEPHVYYDNQTGQYSGEYVFAVAATGTNGPGFMPVKWRGNGVDAFTIQPNGFFEVQRRVQVLDDALDSPFQVWRTGSTKPLTFESRVASNDGTAAHMFFSKARGTIAAPTEPLNGDNLGDIRFGFMNSAGPRAGGILRFRATENWVAGSEHGTQLEVRITKTDTASTMTGLFVTEGILKGALSVSHDYGHVGLELLTFQNAAGSATFLGRAGGTQSAPTAPGGGGSLAEYRAGSYNNNARVTSAMLRFVTTEAWAFGTNQGTRAEIQITRGATATPVTAFLVSNPSATRDSSLELVFNDGAGGLTQRRIIVGAADSGGAGFRALTIAN